MVGTGFNTRATNSTLIIKPGSTVDGSVSFTGAPTTSIINTFLLSSGARVVQSGNTLAVITPDAFGSSQQIISQTVRDAGNVVNNRQQVVLLGDTSEMADGARYAASTSSMNGSKNSNVWSIRDRKLVWLEGTGSYQERGMDGQTSASTARSGGVMAGVGFPKTHDGIRTGFYLGGFSGKLNIGQTTFRSVESNGGMAGGYLGKNFGEYYVSGQLELGITDNSSDRYTGTDIASANYNSYFISPSLTVMRPIAGDGITWGPSAAMRYTAQFDNSDTESGSLANQKLASRTGHSLDGRLMMDAKFDPLEI